MPDKKSIGEPHVLDLTQVTIEMRADPFGRIDFRYWAEEPDTGQEYLLTNIRTEVYDAPDGHGNLRSLMQKLKPDYSHETMVAYFDLLAAKNRAVPILVTQSEKEKYDPLRLQAGAPGTATGTAMYAHQTASLLANRVATPTGTRMRGLQTDSIESGTMQYNQNAHWSAEDAEAMQVSISPLLNMPFFASHLELKQGRSIASPTLPESSGDFLLKFRQARQERTFTIMGVPIAMLSRESSPITGTSDKKLSSSNAHLNTFLLFQNSQQTLKHDMTALLTAMFEHIYRPLETMTRNRSRQTPRSITVQIPSVPDQEAVIRFYQAGWLKYDQLIAYLSDLNGIPMDSFNPEPEISVPEANGIMPEEPPAKKAKKK